MSSSTAETSIQRFPGLNVAAPQKLSTGDPTNPLFIPGLTLHLPPPGKRKYFMFTLFESCTRSNLSLEVKVTVTEDKYTTKIFIEGNWISTARRSNRLQSKKRAAKKALDTLSMFQPCRYKTEKETMLSNDDRVQGLELYDCGGSGMEDAMEVLMRSCRKCNLQVSWWEGGDEIFHSTVWSAVLLIDGKPICHGGGGDLDGAKKNAAGMAIIKLLRSHPVVITDDTKDDEQRNSDESLRSRENGAKQKHSASDEKEPSPNNCALEKLGDAVTHSQKRQRTPQSPTDDVGTEKLPNFTLFLPDNYHSSEGVADYRLILLESCFVNNILIKVDCQKYGTQENTARATVKLKDLNAEKVVTFVGHGKEYQYAKINAAQRAVRILHKCQPCVYKKHQFLGTDDQVKGLTLYLTSSSSQDNKKKCLSELEESCAKCDLLMTWWDDGGSYLFGPAWTLVLVINSRPICWGSGHTAFKAKENVAKLAVDRLKTNHTVVYHSVEDESKETDSEQESSPGQKDKLRFTVLSAWYRRDGTYGDIHESSNRLIENHLQKLLVTDDGYIHRLPLI